jgi:hypothetical protein
MADYRPSDVELVEAFLGQADRYTHSGLELSDCFSWEAFALVFTCGTVLQRSAVRQALLACISLPAVDSRFATPVRHITLEKHLSNWLLHVLTIIADDPSVDSSDRRMARAIVETASPETQITTVARDEANLRPATETEAPLQQHFEQAPHPNLQRRSDEALNASLQQQIEQALKEVVLSRDRRRHRDRLPPG